MTKKEKSDTFLIIRNIYATVLRKNYAKFRSNGISSIPIERTRIREDPFFFRENHGAERDKRGGFASDQS